MKDKLITLSYIFNGNVIKIKQAIECNLEIRINKQFIKQLADNNIVAITILDDNYPRELLQLHDPPYVLYCIGNTNLLKSNKSGVIGSRSNSNYSENICKALIKDLDDDTVIVSGLAKGIDSFAHLYAMQYNKNTIAVIGSGLDCIYPACNKDLAKKISENHLIISEYPLGINARKYHFPLRNRIIAALSTDLYVIEAAEQSGSLITANIAIELGKNIYCAPGSIFAKSYQGSHKLINDGAYLLEFKREV